MADTWGGSWGTSWGTSWFRTIAPPQPEPEKPTGGAGDKPKRRRKRYLINGQLMELDDQELQMVFAALLQKPATEPPKTKPERPRKKRPQTVLQQVESKPQYQALAQQFHADAAVRAILEQAARHVADLIDDEDVEMLLLYG